LINCTTTPRPFQPAHFLAIRHSTAEPNVTWTYHMDNVGRNSNDAPSTASTSWTTMLWENIRDALNLTNIDGSKSNSNMNLEAMLVICGTKDVADMMSDALLEPTPYGNSTHMGLAHSGIHQSALYIHNTYRDFLENLIQKTNRTMLKLWLIGHSLGGGTAALACLEFNKPYHTTNTSTSWNSSDVIDNMNSHNNQNNTVSSIHAYALGFGTPAVLSREYSENARSKVTTVINDADCVPRMSGATLVNFLLNVTASNHWITEAQIDVLHLKDIMKEKSPFPDIWVDTVMSTVYDWIASSDIVNDTMKAALSEKVVAPVLFPPGECLHIYRDGTSWQGVYYPCRNFNALEGVRYMVDDHLIPTGYYLGLLGYIRGSKNDMNWQFKPDLTEIPVSS
jgi:Lipase (class 3)